MSLLKKNIIIKGSAFPSKCNIYPYSNRINKKFLPFYPYLESFKPLIDQLSKGHISQKEFWIKFSQIARFYSPTATIFTEYYSLNRRPLTLCQDGLFIHKNSETIISNSPRKLCIENSDVLLACQNDVLSLGTKLAKNSIGELILASNQPPTWLEASSMFSRFDIPIHTTFQHEKYWPEIHRLLVNIELITGISSNSFNVVANLSKSNNLNIVGGICSNMFREFKFLTNAMLYSSSNPFSAGIDSESPLLQETGVYIYDKKGNKIQWDVAALDWINNKSINVLTYQNEKFDIPIPFQNPENFYEIFINELTIKQAKLLKFQTIEVRQQDFICNLGNPTISVVEIGTHINDKIIPTSSRFSHEGIFNQYWTGFGLASFSFLTQAEKKKFRKDMVIIMRIAREYRLLRYLMPMMRRFTKKHFF